MFRRSVRLERELYKQAAQHAAQAGYSSLEEFVAHVLEKELERSRDDDPEDLVRKRLSGLGYLS